MFLLNLSDSASPTQTRQQRSRARNRAWRYFEILRDKKCASVVGRRQDEQVLWRGLLKQREGDAVFPKPAPAPTVVDGAEAATELACSPSVTDGQQELTGSGQGTLPPIVATEEVLGSALATVGTRVLRQVYCNIKLGLASSARIGNAEHQRLQHMAVRIQPYALGRPRLNGSSVSSFRLMMAVCFV